MRPQIREETVTKRKPKMTTRMAAMTLWYQTVAAPGTGWNVISDHTPVR